MNPSLASLGEAFVSPPWWALTGFATGLMLFCCGCYALFRALRVRFWAVAEGEIKESYLRRRKHKDKYGCHIYDPVVKYTFTAKGKSITTDVVTHHRTVLPEPRGALLNRFYHVGKKVKVYHHPQRPDWALLQPAALQKRVLATVAGLVLMAGFGTFCSTGTHGGAWRVAVGQVIKVN